MKSDISLISFPLVLFCLLFFSYYCIVARERSRMNFSFISQINYKLPASLIAVCENAGGFAQPMRWGWENEIVPGRVFYRSSVQSDGISQLQ